MLAEPRLKTYQQQIDARLDALLPSDSEPPRELARAMRYACLGPGKRIRPILTLASAQATREQEASLALDWGCAVEMVHCFSLIHDDLPALDNDDLRRGRPTTHKVFGEALAILAGDALFALAFEVLSTSGEACGILARACGARGLVAGEVEDLEAEGKDWGADELVRIHHRKTATLLGAACELGALSSAASLTLRSAVREYGQALGMAFQITDDLLNETANSEQLGKAAGSDRDRKKLTFPSVFGIDESRKLAEEWRDRALSHLAPLTGDVQLLRDLALFTTSRSA